MTKTKFAVLAGFSAAALAVFAQGIPQALAADDVDAQAKESWREAIVKTPVPGEACFHASYPSTVWTKVECTEAPNRPYLPRSRTGPMTVGDGDDYAAEVTGLMTSSVGSFPTVTGVTSETDNGASNTYSLQLNSNFMKTAVCNGKSSYCLSWEQFVYSSSEKSAFMQYWLIYYGRCPSGWNKSGLSCYKNSAAVAVPTLPISQLSGFKVSATAVNSGIDTLVFTTSTEAYSTTGQDSVVDLATGWTESEFNIVGDGGGSEAVFNSGSSVTVKVAVSNGTTSVPTCLADAGTTGETNNLTLSSCNAAGGSAPYITFVESN